MVDIVFILSALLCLASAMTIVTRKNPVYAVIFMLPFFIGMAVLFVLLSAPFMAAMQMMVYGGAILVVFLFVIMLINLRPEELQDDFNFTAYIVSALAGGFMGGLILSFALKGISSGMSSAFEHPLKPGEGQPAFGSIESLAKPLFQVHLIPFEMISILIVVALLGAVVLAKKRI